MRLLLLVTYIGNSSSSFAQTEARTLGNKSYEVSNHLGNVMAVVSDRKMASPEASNTSIAYNETDIKAFNDFYPYGMFLDNRNDSKEYRYGFQGQEKDDEVKGSNNSINYKYRVHDPRLGRFFAVDPLTSKYPHYSSYQFSGNKVIQFVELEGLEEKKSENPIDCELNVDSEKSIRTKKEIYFTRIIDHFSLTIAPTIISQNTNLDLNRNFDITFGTFGGNISFDAGNTPDRIIVTDRSGKIVFDRITGYNNVVETNLPAGDYQVQIILDSNETGITSGSSVTYVSNIPPLFLRREKLKFLGITIAKKKSLTTRAPKNSTSKGEYKNLRRFKKTKRANKKHTRRLMQKYGVKKGNVIKRRL